MSGAHALCAKGAGGKAPARVAHCASKKRPHREVVSGVDLSQRGAEFARAVSRPSRAFAVALALEDGRLPSECRATGNSSAVANAVADAVADAVPSASDRR